MKTIPNVCKAEKAGRISRYPLQSAAAIARRHGMVRRASLISSGRVIMKIPRNILIIDEERIDYLQLDPRAISQIDIFVVIRGEEAHIVKDRDGEQDKTMPLAEFEAYLRQRE